MATVTAEPACSTYAHSQYAWSIGPSLQKPWYKYCKNTGDHRCAFEASSLTLSIFRLEAAKSLARLTCLDKLDDSEKNL